MGWRGRERSGPWPGAGPFSQLPPWQRPGWIYGYGRGMGLGRGVGYGYLGTYNPWVCQRFPWLPRWWWASTYHRAHGIPPSFGYGYRYMSPFPIDPTPDVELEMLNSYMEQLKGEEEAVNKRIDELKKAIEEGAQRGDVPFVGQMPYWGLRMYGTPTTEQERMFLEQQAKALEGQIEAIKKRLEELKKGN